MRSIVGALRSLLARTRFEREMREEIRFHVERRADDLVATGLPREEALRRARLEFGAVEAWKERCRDASGFSSARLLHGITGDIRLATRRLLAAPAFTVFSILSLAVGVGVTAAMYSVVRATFWSSAGATQPDRVLELTEPGSGRMQQAWIQQSDYDYFAAAQRSFALVGGSERFGAAAVFHALTELTAAELVTGEYFRVFGTRPALGRLLESGDESADARVVVLSHDVWRRRFQSSPAVVGQTLRISGRNFEIVGVAEKRFRGSSPAAAMATALWLPRRSAPVLTDAVSGEVRPDRWRSVLVYGLLKPGVSLPTAAGEIGALAAARDAEQPQFRLTGRRVAEPRGWSARTLEEARASRDPVRIGVLLVALVGLVLVVACTNLSNLVLARGSSRYAEFAVRRALGASRSRLIREQLAETAILAVAGGIASSLVLVTLRHYLSTEIPMGHGWTLILHPELDARVVAAASIAVLLALAVFGLEPAFQLTRRTDVQPELAARAGSVGVPRSRRQRTLLRWQVAISTGFFIIATMCVKYTFRELRHDPGMEMDGIAVAEILVRSQGWDDARIRRELERILEAAQRTPGLDAVSISTGFPFGTYTNSMVDVSLPGGSPEPVRFKSVAATDGVFRVTGIPVLRGRGFDARDDAASAGVAVLSESAARRVFGTADAVGRQIQLKTLQPAETHQVAVVGVARDTDTTYLSRRDGVIYRPLSQQFGRGFVVSARSREGSAAATAALAAALRRANPDIPTQYLGPARPMLAGGYALLRRAGLLALGLGATTLLLAMVGLFGIQSNIVSHRTREIGVRLTFGASGRQIKTMVLRDGSAPVLQGLAIGVFVGFAGRAIVRSYLDVTVSIVDPWMFVAVPVPLLLAAFFACWLPAHRASRVDPTVALRHT